MTRAGDDGTRPAFAAELGVVFCGGESRRMGRDKAALAVGGRTLLERAIGCLSSVVPEVVLACGSEDRYTELGRERILDPEPGLGPIGGLLAALRRLQRQGTEPGRSILYALACDMPLVDPGMFRELRARLDARRADVALVESELGLEPLLAVYRASVLPAVERAVARGDRRLTSFHGEVAVLRVPAAELGESSGRAARTNVNTPADLRAVEGRLA